MYARQPIMIFLLSMALYGFYKFYRSKKPWAFGMIILSWSLSFGIDSTLFLSLSIALPLLLTTVVKAIKKKKHMTKSYAVALLPGVIVFLLNVLANVYIYDTFSFAQYHRHDLFSTIPSHELQGFLLSVPFFPTIFYVLFSFTRLDPAIFAYIEKYPKVAFIFSTEYAKKYVFYGLFAISPFFWQSCHIFIRCGTQKTECFMLHVVLFLRLAL
ncbi:MAG: hypothetical protein UZ22_OP11002000835 [Microgenomates bacterium OLB23]|nr:MAG: hypothetical protein UZ22_OP11002000835 [Microgenomates bacterium OLB23]